MIVVVDKRVIVFDLLQKVAVSTFEKENCIILGARQYQEDLIVLLRNEEGYSVIRQPIKPQENELNTSKPLFKSSRPLKNLVICGQLAAVTYGSRLVSITLDAAPITFTVEFEYKIMRVAVNNKQCALGFSNGHIFVYNEIPRSDAAKQRYMLLDKHFNKITALFIHQNMVFSA